MNMSNDFINDFGLNDSSSSSLLATKTPEPSPSSSSEINAASKTSLNGSVIIPVEQIVVPSYNHS